ncbi:DNA/RNA non-specific endonuclease [Burkholderia cenocepacia]|uniref:DNA/RNA non-specific endonuclease n=1 Tax=Burkholderia cenocepacia TaxID=95486 RepID=UPI000761B9A1|nr:DNA/RNA non-specific endonuclease [Burkholderia cenocepacia]KWU17957.1 endonuclease [Burkholderia cenocepacia]
MKAIVAGLLLTLASSAFAADACTSIFPNGEQPVLTNPKLALKTRYLCQPGYAVLHSGITHTPLWSAEHLTRASLQAGRGLTRTNRFYEEPALPAGDGATLADYARSGWDRGHNVPAGDSESEEEMQSTFSLVNISPQNPQANRHTWAALESAVRKLAKQSGEAYVTTGPLFLGRSITTIGRSKVFVPTQFYKVVYLPSQRLSFAIVMDNVDTDQYSVKTVHELEALSGIQFRGIPDSLKDKTIEGVKGV